MVGPGCDRLICLPDRRDIAAEAMMSIWAVELGDDAADHSPCRFSGHAVSLTDWGEGLPVVSAEAEAALNTVSFTR